jgi:hypothetical protein
MSASLLGLSGCPALLSDNFEIRPDAAATSEDAAIESSTSGTADSGASDGGGRGADDGGNVLRDAGAPAVDAEAIDSGNAVDDAATIPDSSLVDGGLDAGPLPYTSLCCATPDASFRCGSSSQGGWTCVENNSSNCFYGCPVDSPCLLSVGGGSVVACP